MSGAELDGGPWQAVIAAVEGGAGAEWCLAERHLRRATNIRIDGAGEVTFDVERHPSLGGRETVGWRSSAFTRLLSTYRFAQGRLDLVEEQELGHHVNVAMVAEEEVSEVLDVVDATSVEKAADRTQAEAAARKVADKVDWLVRLQEELGEAQREELRQACKELAVTRLLERWSEGMGG